MARVRQRAQNVFEFALCLAVVVAAMGSLAIYVRRSLQARYRAGVVYRLKSIEDEAARPEYGGELPIKLTEGKHQYEPYYTREAVKTEKKEGVTTEGFPKSSIDMSTKTLGWRNTPLPEKWRRE